MTHTTHRRDHGWSYYHTRRRRHIALVWYFIAAGLIGAAWLLFGSGLFAVSIG